MQAALDAALAADRPEGLLDPALAAALDAADPVAHTRARFLIPPASRVGGREGGGGAGAGGGGAAGADDKPCVYLCGNSLGLQPAAVREYVCEELDKWATLGE
jgi:kynureninase